MSKTTSRNRAAKNRAIKARKAIKAFNRKVSSIKKKAGIKVGR